MYPFFCPDGGKPTQIFDAPRQLRGLHSTTDLAQRAFPRPPQWVSDVLTILGVISSTQFITIRLLIWLPKR